VVIFAVFAVLVIIFVILPLVGWAIGLVIWTAIVGAIFGAIGRLIVPGHQPIGVLATICCGWAGSIIGGVIGRAAGLHHLATILIEIGVAAGAVAILASTQRGRVAGAGSRGVLNR
jgi:uncharacterized membrane protein YeaQ/YmgE (transglycosylase-associated protein family)